VALLTRREVVDSNPDDAGLLDRLTRLAIDGLPLMYRPDAGVFCFTRAFSRTPDGHLESELRGVSLRYSAIVALGAHWLPEPEQRAVLSGHSLEDFVGSMVERLDARTNLGDAALVCWAAAQAGLPVAKQALEALKQLDRLTTPEYVVEIAWVVSALSAARRDFDVEAYLATARTRLLDSILPGSPVFPHVTGAGLVKGYRSHVSCFADQVYPIQALARLHHSGDDPQALRAAQACAEQICKLQGEDGQWWWHYDARSGALVEGYPVYTVHQHAMAPMALFDLAEASGLDFSEPIRRGLRWIAGPAELGDDGEDMVYDDEGVTWRKVYRGDPRKVVRGLHTMTTRAFPGLKVPGVGLFYRPNSVDRECRPYEFGWLFFAWLANLGPGGTESGRSSQPDPEGRR
jgi:hypothetical protein